MIDPTVFGLYLAAAGAMILSPGPDTIYVLTRSVGEGRRIGIASAVGISLGVVVHTLAAVVGLAALFRASEPAFLAVTYVGAGYLVYLGVRTVRSDALRADSIDGPGSAGRDAPGVATVTGPDRSTGRNPMTEAVAVNVLNPQVALFFLAFLPQFVSGAWIELQLLVLGGTYAALTALYLGGIAAAAGTLRTLLVTRPAISAAVRWLSGAVLVGLGLRLLLFGP